VGPCSSSKSYDVMTALMSGAPSAFVGGDRTRGRWRRRRLGWFFAWGSSQRRSAGHLAGVMPFGRSRARASGAGLIDDDAFEDLYFRVADRLLVFMVRRTADPEIAADLWAESWSRAVAQREAFRGNTQAEQEGWVFGIARNVLAGFYKRGEAEQRAVRRLGLERPVMSDADLVRLEREAGLSELRQALATALEGVPDSQRESLQLRVIEGLSYPEVAARLGITEENARARVCRALRRLGDVLDSSVGPSEEA
jgi:RNA polymerase sigma factor (sigma-70 family)